MNLSLSLAIDKSADEVAAVFCDFARLRDWFPGIQSCGVEGEGEGAVRKYLIGEKAYRDRLLSVAPDGRGYQYEQLEGPIPVASLRATVTVSAVGETGCEIAWNADVEPGQMPPGAVEGALTQLTMAGMKLLQTKLKLGDDWPDEPTG